MKPTDLPSMNYLRSAASPAGARPFHVGIVIGPGYNPMDMVGIHTVATVIPGAQIHFLWKTHDLVEGYPSWWTRPTTTFAEAPDKLDVLAVPMMMPEVQNDPEVIAFVRTKAKLASHIVGICNGVLVLGAAGLLIGRRATTNHNSLPLLSELGVSEVVPADLGVVQDGNIYTAGPGLGCYEAMFRVVENAFGLEAAQFAEVAIEYDPRPVYGMGVASQADPKLLKRFEEFMEPLVKDYRIGSLAAYNAVTSSAHPTAA
ncbi:DJ-1/PfpI family protein [Mesorhizobium sp. CO1-1-8]|uniref:DJ-1/PfpI family protein n=1 Tax=Mesorhizobium sp. CO1-1-8 TaxID=2876631 RepID=UPI001CD10CD7|nr:DJ-1/PfpI family protein [Mesorhizobium sp. CO1-1-8]MBZ9772540.1 DJ-1/PfpI family protein [Mesorhizobium sp. CO1-1-8]